MYSANRNLCYKREHRIYFDICAIQRPLQTRTHLQVALEAEAVLGILALCEDRRVEIVPSDALMYETEQNPLPVRWGHSSAVLSKAAHHIKLSDEAEKRAEEFVALRIKPLDALHRCWRKRARWITSVDVMTDY